MKTQKDTSRSESDAHPQEVLALKNSLCEELDKQVDNLDFNITSRLSAARHRAVAGDASLHRPGELRFRVRPALAGVACIAVLSVFLVSQLILDEDDNRNATVAVFEQTPLTDSTIEQTSIIQDLQILSAADDIDFYQSVEFLEWMERNSG